MKKTSPNNEMQVEYALASMKGGVRGKYAKRYREGTNLVLLEPDVSEAFPTDKAVNQALRGILKITRTVRSTSKLASKAYIPPSAEPAPNAANLCCSIGACHLAITW
ncbi:MAG TPA: hypothetical protein VGK22_16495 [Candidatus Angelobacter sp.]|jgi:hypothetical protein